MIDLATIQQRNAERLADAIDYLGPRYVLHPSNKQQHVDEQERVANEAAFQMEVPLFLVRK